MAFLHTVDERFLVLSEFVRGTANPTSIPFSLTVFDHENTFMKMAATADLPKEMTVRIISDVLLSVTQPVFPHRWLDLDMSEVQRTNLGLQGVGVEARYTIDEEPAEEMEEAGDLVEDAKGLFGFPDHEKQFYEFLMQAPTPFVMLAGPEHRMSFINPPYARLLGRLNQDTMIGRPVREALPELEGQPFFGLLDQVYRTGVRYVGTEVPIRLRSEATGEHQDCFVDFIYHPVRNKAGAVWGIMIQATEVTERVLSREVANSREQQLYTQWLELEAIYKTAPLGLVIFDADDLKVLRINETQAELLGSSVSELVGKSVEEIAFQVPQYKELIQRVMAGDPVRNTLIEAAPGLREGQPRMWLVNITPFRNSADKLEKLCCISLEIPQEMLPAKSLRAL